METRTTRVRIVWAVALAAGVMVLGACGNTRFMGKSAGAKASDTGTAGSDSTVGGGQTESTSGSSGAIDAVTDEGELGGATTPGSESSAKDSSGGSATNAELVSQCAAAVGGQAAEVVQVTSGNPELTLNPDSIILLHVSGNAQLSWDALKVSSIKGLCIEAQGGASLSLDASLIVSAMHYYGRGHATSSINFGATGNLAKLVTDIGGSHRLVVQGELIDCGNLVQDQGGSSTLTCSGGTK